MTPTKPARRHIWTPALYGALAAAAWLAGLLWIGVL